MKKLFAILLCAAMLLVCLAGCGTSGVTPTATNTPGGTTDPGTTGEHDWDAAHTKFQPNEVVMTVDGSEVTWGEFFYWLYYSIGYQEQHLGIIENFDETSLISGDQTNNQYFLESAVDLVIQCHALEVNSDKAGVVLSAEDDQYLKDLLATDILSILGDDGTEEEFYEYLEGIYVSKDLYNYMNHVSVLYNKNYEALYGKDGDKLMDDAVMVFANANGFLSAKHILISTKDAEGEDLSEDERAKKLAKAEDILAQLKIATNLEAKFDELMNEHSEDPGLTYYPGGYCFAPGKMVEAFENAVVALDDYSLSEIIETNNGYHIILRIPTLPTNIVEYYSADEQYDLRYAASVSLYDEQLTAWMDEADVVWTKKFETLSLNQLFGIETSLA